MIVDSQTGTNDFRRIVKEVSILEGYEALKNLPTVDVDIVTPVEKTRQPMVAVKNLCFVPILRAGMGLVDGILRVIPNAKFGHIGMYRDDANNHKIEGEDAEVEL